VRATSRFSGSHRVVLASAALGLEHGALNGETSAGDPLGVAGLDLGDRLRARSNTGRGHRLQERLGHGPVEPHSAERLAHPSGDVKVAPARARVARDLPTGA
jgi:hypothetical protein